MRQSYELHLTGDQVPFHRDKDFHLLPIKQFIGGQFCVRPFQVAHHEPPYLFLILLECHYFASGQYYQSCTIVNFSTNQAVTNIVRKSSGFLPVLVPLFRSHQKLTSVRPYIGQTFRRVCACSCCTSLRKRWITWHLWTKQPDNKDFDFSSNPICSTNRFAASGIIPFRIIFFAHFCSRFQYFM